MIRDAHSAAQVERCLQIRAWCRQNLSLVNGWLVARAGPALPMALLLSFRDRLTTIDQEAAWLEATARAGLVDPVFVARLTHGAMRLISEWQQAFPTIPEAGEEREAKERVTMDRDTRDWQRTVPIGQHELPPLPYGYDALEPYIDEQTMRLHHDRHHRTYVDGLNNAERTMARARETGEFALIKHWEREAAFHGAGHYLHTIFWNVMSPGGGGEPDGELAEQIRRDFGSFKGHFSAAAEQVEGGGWAILVWAPRPRRLEILTAEKHQNLSQWDVIPLLVLDVWEHAYYLKYQNERRRYIDAWWNVVNWPHVAERFQQAKAIRWEPW